MPGKDLNYRITVDQSAGSAGIRDFSRTVTSELRKVDSSLGDTATASQKAAATLTKMADAAEVELRQAAKAADALAAALGPEMAAKLGQNGIAQAVGDLNRMGVAFADIEADADQLAAAMKRVDEVQTSATEAGLGNLNGRLNETDDAANKARNSLANMFGNTAQDASSLFGNLGSLGVGIGQLAEGAADAALGGQGLTSALKGTVAMAGPIAALGAAMALLGDITTARAKSAEADAKATQQLTDAYRKGGDAAANYADELRDAGEITATFGANSLAQTGKLGSFVALLGPAGDAISDIGQAFHLFGDEVGDISPMLARAGISVEAWSAAVVGANKGYGDLSQALKGTSLDAVDQRKILDALAESQTRNSEAKRNAAAIESVFGDETEDTTGSVERQTRALDRAKGATDALIDSVDREADARRDAADALKDQADALKDQIGAAEDAADNQIRTEQALARFNEVLKDHKASAEDARDAAVEFEKQQVATAESVAAAAGVTYTSTQRIDDQNEALLKTAKTAKGPARDAILNYIASLNGIPPEKVSEVIPNIDDLSLEEAMTAMAGVSATRTAAVIADAQTAQAEQDIDELTRQRYLDIYFRYRNTQVPVRSPTGAGGAPAPALAPTGPTRRFGATALDAVDPAAAAMPTGGAIVSPFVVDVAVPTSATSLTLDMRGAILGSRYDITRTVRSAVRDGVRLAGTRGLSP